MTHLIVIGDDLRQLSELAASAGPDFRTTSLIHSTDVLGRAILAQDDAEAVLVLCLRGPLPSDLGRLDRARTIVVTDSPGALDCSRLAASGAHLHLRDALHRITVPAAPPNTPRTRLRWLPRTPRRSPGRSRSHR